MLKNEIKVSVIMSTYKTEETILNEAINSILNQSYKNIEFIIVCDGDREEYNRIKKINNSKIKILFNEVNKGLPYSLNLAIKNSTGDYIARMDSDDIALENRIEKQINFMEEHKDVGVCGMNAILFGKENGRKEIYLNTEEQIKIQLLYRATLIHPTVMIRRCVVEEYKYNEEFICSQDFELWSRISEKFKIAILPIIGLKYRVHEKQASIEKQQLQKKLAMRIIKNNSIKISEKFEERICKTLYILGGREKLTKSNYIEISKNIDYMIDKNIKYNKKDFKKVLYNRFFELIIKNKIIPLNFNVLKKCLRIYNLKEILEVLKK